MLQTRIYNSQDIYEAALEGRYEEVMELLQCPGGRPEGAMYLDEKTGCTALHLACRENVPVHVIKALLWNATEMACVQDTHDGNSPLHILCGIPGSSEEALLLLIQAYPFAVFVQNKSGQIPLHIALWHKSVRVIQILLQAGPSQISICNEDKLRPLELMFPKNLESMWYRIATIIGGYHKVSTTEDRTALDALAPGQADRPDHRLWIVYRKIIILLQMEETRGMNHVDCRQFSIMQALLKVDVCHPALFELALKIYPQLACQTDSDGNTPLHTAASMPQSTQWAFIRCMCTSCNMCDKKSYEEPQNMYYDELGFVSCHACMSDTSHADSRFVPIHENKAIRAIKGLLNIFPRAAMMCNKAGDLPLHLFIRCGHQDDSIIRALLASYPNAARVPDPSGTLPLVSAIQNGMTWESGIRRIFLAAPEVLKVRDSNTKLYPFMLAAAGADANHNDADWIMDTLIGDGQETGQEDDLNELNTLFCLLCEAPELLNSGIILNDQGM